MRVVWRATRCQGSSAGRRVDDGRGRAADPGAAAARQLAAQAVAEGTTRSPCWTPWLRSGRGGTSPAPRIQDHLPKDHVRSASDGSPR